MIRIGIAASGPRTSDPNQTTQGGDNWATEQMYEQLVRPDDGTFATTPDQYIPTLATEWATSTDAKTWTFKLRQGVQFHKGYGEMTSDDVVFSFKRAIEDGTNTTILANIADVVAKGPYEVDIHVEDARRQPAWDVDFLQQHFDRLEEGLRQDRRREIRHRRRRHRPV